VRVVTVPSAEQDHPAAEGLPLDRE
jgi:hypothetical protein